MFKNYLTVALRNLLKHKFYSFINVSGLSIGITCFLLIAVFVEDELSYDDFHRDGDRIYRVDFWADVEEEAFEFAGIGAPAAQAMLEEFPEVEDALRIISIGNFMIRKEEATTTYKLDEIAYVDTNFFEFFDFPLIAGDPASCLENPNSIVLRKDEAEKIFGNEDPIGKTVVLDKDKIREVTGVFEMPANSHLKYQMLFSMENKKSANSTEWASFYFHTYLKLKKGSDPKLLEAKFPPLVELHFSKAIEEWTGNTLEEFYEDNRTLGLLLFPMKDIHLKSHKRGELRKHSDVKYVYIFSAVAVFIIILACINFMNLSTARAAGRAKEVGIRKVIGARKSQLIVQFLAEAFLLTVVAIVIAYALSLLSLSSFNDLADKEIPFARLFSVKFLLMAFFILIIVVFTAGSYPAFFLSWFMPIDTLKGKVNLGMKSGGIRGTLVVLQFAVSIIILISTGVVFRQLSYIQNKELGYSKDQVVILHDVWIIDDSGETLKEVALQHPNISNGTRSYFLPTSGRSNTQTWFPARNHDEEKYELTQYYVDRDYLKTMKMEIVQGRDFSMELPSDTNAVILNETAAQLIGKGENPVGKMISTYVYYSDSLYIMPHKIVGVAKDFHFRSLRSEIDPLVIRAYSDYWNFLSFKISAKDIPATLDYLRDQWNEFVPGQPFQYTFLDDEFNKAYRKDQKMSEVFVIFAGLAIFIACLGLYGLTAFAGEQRVREIGVRKVLGASVFGITLLLSKEFIKLVGIAFLISAPIGYYLMNQWLQDFENRTDIHFSIFLISGALAFLIAWGTTSFQAWKAASVNPTKSLKND